MKHLRKFKIFENLKSTKGLTEEKIKILNSLVGDRWSFDENYGVVDVKGNLILNSTSLYLHDIQSIKFGHVSGNFGVSVRGRISDTELNSLEWGPSLVDGYFDCSENNLTTLVGCPEVVGGDFYSMFNKLTSLVGSPRVVKGTFDVTDNPIVSLEGAPEIIQGGFACDYFVIHAGNWSIRGWTNILTRGNQTAKKIILTLPYLGPESLQREIEKNPGKWVVILREIWNSEEFRPIRDQLKVSDQFLKDIGDQSALSDLGF